MENALCIITTHTLISTEHNLYVSNLLIRHLTPNETATTKELWTRQLENKRVETLLYKLHSILKQCVTKINTVRIGNL